jgi:hypothetical protein
MLTCFTTSSCLFFYAFCETKQTRFLYWFFGALTLGMLTKGVAALLFTPALLIFALFTTPLTHFLKNKHFYIGLLSLAFFVVGFYLLRESRNPGYIATVQENELGGRYMVAQGGGEFDFWYYFKNIVDYSLADRYLLIPCGMLIGAFSRDRRIRKFSLFLTLCVVTYFLVISIAKTKVGWYNVPMYPFIAILIAFFVNFFFEFLRDLPKARESMARNVIPYLFLFLIFFSSYREVWSRTHAPNERFWDAEFYHIGAYLKDALRGNVSLQNKFLVSEGYFGQNLFYTHILRDRKINTGFKNIDDVKKGDVLLVYQDEVRKRLKEKFVCGEKCERWDIFTLMVGEPRE